jgi:DNA-binding NarL/FixJ family response regulator
MSFVPQTAKRTRLKKRKRAILIVDDHPLFRRGIADLLNQEKDLEVRGEAATCAEALAAIRREPFELVIIDIGLGDGADGLETTKVLKAEQPKIRILIVSMRDEALYAGRCLRAGARGYVMKRESNDCVLAAVRSVFAGEVYVSPAMGKRFIRNRIHGSSEQGAAVDLLTDRELEVLHLIGHGNDVRKIAMDLHLSRKTIEAHREHIKEKLDFRTSRELARFAVQWLTNGEHGADGR